jgi:hypothetical protein
MSDVDEDELDPAAGAPLSDNGANDKGPTSTEFVPRPGPSVVAVGGSAVLYFVAFAAVTWPSITRFSSHLLGDQIDGLQNYWNLWWVNKAVTGLHQNPWYTRYLHYPQGVSLLPHTLNPANGFFAIPLLRIFSLQQTYNLILVATFVVGGVTAYLLCYRLTANHWASVVGGFVFAFSNYHFAQATGHMQVMSLEWIPLFALCAYSFVTNPRLPAALGSAFSLWIIAMTDYYFFFYSVLFGIVLVLWQMWRRRDVLFFLRRPFRVPLGAFVAAATATSGALVAAFFRVSRGGIVGAHAAPTFSTDLFAPFIPGGHWRYASLTKGYWSRLPGNTTESSVYVGLSVIVLAVCAYVWNRRDRITDLVPWTALGLMFLFLSFGPVLHVWGKEHVGPAFHLAGKAYHIPLPYGILANVFPPLKLSGAPVRMMVMTQLALAVMVSVALTAAAKRSMWIRILAIALVAAAAVEYLPSPLPSIQVPVPRYVAFLKEQPGNGAVIDSVAVRSFALYYQTIDGKPMAYGYLARLPKKTLQQDELVAKTLAAGRFDVLCRTFGFRYFVTTKRGTLKRGPAYGDGQVFVFDLGTDCHV